jgi:pimeloyl-ACP methyl ester carboxylesterase
VAIGTFNIDTPRGFFGARAFGLESAPLVLLLHGFPDDAGTFDHLLPKLAAMGAYAVAPYLRGYAPSTLMPPFGVDALAEDLCAIAAKLSRGKPIDVIGHDWGALAFYRAAVKAPHHFRRAVVMATPHPQALAANAKWSPRQQWRSRYMLYLQRRTTAERGVMAGGLAYVDTLWKRWSPGFAPPADHLAAVKKTFHASMPAPIEMYRSPDLVGPSDPIAIPTLYLTGRNDACIGPEMAAGQERYFSNDYRIEVVPDAGHFLHHEQPEAVLKLIGQWLSETQ